MSNPYDLLAADENEDPEVIAAAKPAVAKPAAPAPAKPAAKGESEMAVAIWWAAPMGLRYALEGV